MENANGDNLYACSTCPYVYYIDRKARSELGPQHPLLSSGDSRVEGALPVSGFPPRLSAGRGARGWQEHV